MLYQIAFLKRKVYGRGFDVPEELLIAPYNLTSDGKESDIIMDEYVKKLNKLPKGIKPSEIEILLRPF